MAKFKIRLKVQGLGLEVEGERQDIPLISAAVTKQLSSIVEPVEVIAETPKHLGNGSGTADGEKVQTPELLGIRSNNRFGRQ